MPALPFWEIMGEQAIALDLYEVWSSGLDHSWNNLSGDQKTSSPLVSCYVVDDVAENWSECKKFAAYHGI